VADDYSRKWAIERLAKYHDRSNFDCGVEALSDFLRERATQFDKRNLGRTFVAVGPDSKIASGYYTLSSSAISFDVLPSADSRHLPSQIPIPVLRLGRLAVDKSTQGQGLGSFLLLDALWRGLRLAGEIAMYAVEVDAIDETARRFYEHFGFTTLLDDQKHLYFPMTKVSKLFPEESK